MADGVGAGFFNSHFGQAAFADGFGFSFHDLGFRQAVSSGFSAHPFGATNTGDSIALSSGLISFRQDQFFFGHVNTGLFGCLGSGDFFDAHGFGDGGRFSHCDLFLAVRFHERANIFGAFFFFGHGFFNRYALAHDVGNVLAFNGDDFFFFNLADRHRAFATDGF